MFHGIPRDDAEYQIDYGDFHLSLVDFVVGIQSALIMFPISIFLIVLFAYTEPRPPKKHVYKTDEKMLLDSDVDKIEELKKKKFRYCLYECNIRKMLGCKLIPQKGRNKMFL